MHARRATFALFTNGVGAASGLLALFFIGRYMTPAAYGTFGFALAFIGVWLLLADLGLERAHIRHISQGSALGDNVAAFRRLKALALLVFVAGVAVALVLWMVRGGRFENATSIWVLLAMAAYGLFVMLRSVPVGTLTALRLTGSVQIMVLVEHLVKTPLVILAALIFGLLTGADVPLAGLASWLLGHLPFDRPLSAADGGFLIAMAWALGLLVSLLVGLVLYTRQSLPRGQHDPILARSYVAFAVPVALIASLRIVFIHVDALLIGWFLAAENVGYYFAADRLSMIAYAIPLTLQMVFFPLFGELAARGDRVLLNGLAGRVQRALSMIMVLIVLFMVVFPAEGIRVFMGDAFLPSSRILPWLAVYLLFLSFTTVSSNVLLALGRPYLVVRIGLIALLVNIVFDLLLIPDTLFGFPGFGYHSAGAAFASALAQGTAVVLLAVATKRHVGDTFLGPALLKHLLAGGIAAAILVAVRTLFFGTVGFLGLIVLTLIGAVVYGAALILMRELTRADITFLRDALHPGRLLADLRTEVKDKRSGR